MSLPKYNPGSKRNLPDDGSMYYGLSNIPTQQSRRFHKFNKSKPSTNNSKLSKTMPICRSKKMQAIIKDAKMAAGVKLRLPPHPAAIPSFSIGQRCSFGSYWKNLSQSPGPAAYGKIPRSNNGPSFSLGRRIKTQETNNNGPGPGAHSVTFNSDIGNIKSGPVFGYRHSSSAMNVSDKELAEYFLGYTSRKKAKFPETLPVSTCSCGKSLRPTCDKSSKNKITLPDINRGYTINSSF